MIEIRNVLCPVDLTPISERALELAAEVAKKVGARLVLEHNLDARPPGYLGVSWMWSEENEASERSKAESAGRRVRELLATVPDAVPHEARLTRGPLELGLLHLCRELPADLMVMGTHGKSDGEHRSLTERLIREAPCPVLTLGESYDPAGVLAAMGDEAPESLNVLLPIDFGKASLQALEYGVALARRMPHRLVLLHTVPSGGRAGKEAIAARARLADRIPESLADRVHVEVETGEPAAVILRAARRWRAIFVLMGARRRGLLRRVLFGATTLEVLHGGGCPVLFVPEGSLAAARLEEVA